MRTIEIDLAQPFEGFLGTVLSLPAGSNNAGGDRLENEVELKQAIHRVYEAANGRRVETIIGFVPIAPPVAPFLKEKLFYVATQIDFLIETATRIICGPDQFDCGTPILEMCGRNARGASARSKPAPEGSDTEPGIEAFLRRFRQPTFPRTQMISHRHD
ncbi:MAG: hypothetical protein DLM73_14045 [Chthoniobacterales bacterium]|nr:MAG: hypothetical protein DLM73_14045 [Chthoniobacterales bacterium]